MINVLAADKLMASPKLYATFLLWLLSELFEKLPEVGDPDKPKLVFFFDEAHLLFNEAPKELLDKIEQVVRLIRSKGVGVYFVTQNPADVPDKCWRSLATACSTPCAPSRPPTRRRSRLRQIRSGPTRSSITGQVITQLGKGEALVSFLEGAGTPAMVDRTIIRPPSARIGPVTDDERKAVIDKSPLKGKYDTTVDPNSAFEILQKRLAEGGTLPAPGAGVPGAPGGSGDAAPAHVGFFHRIGLWFKNLFGVGRASGERLTTSQQVARNVARAVVAGVATQVASEFAKSTGGKTAGNIGKAVVRGALGGVLRR